MPDPRPRGGFHPLLAELARLDLADLLGRYLGTHPHSPPSLAAGMSWDSLAGTLADDYDREHGRRGRAAPRPARPQGRPVIRPHRRQRARAAGEGRRDG